MDNGPKTLDLNITTAVDKLKAQMQFCKREKERFKRCNAQDSTTFYAEKIQEFKWQILQLQQHYESSGQVLNLKRETVSVPVAADNERLSDEQLELDVSNVFFNPTTESKKHYFLRYVICLPLQKHVLQEQKTEFFRTNDLSKVETQRFFHYPRNGLKMCDSLKRGYMTVELYAERKLKAPTLVGIPQRVPLNRFLEEHSIKGVLSFGDKGEWDISYSLNIRRAQFQEEKDNFKMVQKAWISLADDSSRLTRRASVATMGHSPSNRHHRKRNNRNRHHHHRHHHHRHHAEDQLSEKTEALSITPVSSDSSLHNNSLENCFSDIPLEDSRESTSSDEVSDRISDLPNGNKNTTKKIKKSISRRLSGFF